ncbi:Transcription initiation factor TFIID subunit 8 [Erysiphe necator]|uniref:Transcription initiation factor TFIID subunit 8 n=1 Tax=Uncinula necator TaxID=52586 RepID=A0A0B1PG34_UNCNE|nr:Transcription initiation factor TFIID subunit 8 [Erysiphe necator]KHJ36250.1 putative bromodomain associated protein [Erysiphe necator]
MMSPISLASLRKRSPSQSDQSKTDEPSSKRRCLDIQSPKSISTLSECRVPIEVPHMFDDGPHRLLIRSVSLVLQHIGFTSSTPEAMESFCCAVENYALHLLSKVTASMLSSRRSLPIPNDFQYALSEFDIPLLSLEPHLHPPVPIPKLLIKLEQLPAEELYIPTSDKLLGEDLSGEAEKKNKPYIPKSFPSFPSKHTYKWTERESARDLDPRKIREEAAKVARQGEEALQRLTKVAKAAKEKAAKKTASKDPKSKERHKIWQSVMENLLSGKNSSLESSLKEKNSENMHTSMIVNAERQYFRKGVTARRNSLQSSDPFKSLKLA